MRISRVVIKNFRSFELLAATLLENTTCVIGENNSGKSNLLQAIRLCIDSGLSSSCKALQQNDIHSAADFTSAIQALVALEIVDFKGKVNEEALVSARLTKPGLAGLIYCFRPKLAVREDILTGEIADSELTLEDCHWVLAGGGDPAVDLPDIEWDTDVGSAIRFSDLQALQVVFLPALRDVENDLRQFRNSPLARLIEAMNVAAADKEALLDNLREANQEISKDKTVKEIVSCV
jgi:putative ATP-dependent endonuclease of the OLD family